MSHLETLPLWAAIPAAAFLVLGASLALIGSFGLLRLPTFYERIHAPTFADIDKPLEEIPADHGLWAFRQIGSFA